MDREEAVQIIENMPISYECREFFNLALEALRQPEIVRCNECKYWNNGYLKYDVHPWLPCMEIRTDKNWYCADGDRK